MGKPSENSKVALATAVGGAAVFFAMKMLAKKGKAMPKNIKLSYFDIEGAGEPVRLALVLAGISFEDDRIKFADWPSIKAKTPYGQVPVMLVDGEMKTQSGAMLRWVGSLDPSKSLYPEDRLYEVEEAIGVIGDLQRAWGPSFYIGMRPKNFGYPEDFNKSPEGQDKIAAMRKTFIEDELPQYLGYISDMIDRNNGQWIASTDKPTIADCMAVPLLRSFTRGHIDHVDVNCIAKSNPKVVQYVERFCALGEIKGRYTNGIGATSSV